MADLDALRPEVRRADSFLDSMACTADEEFAVKTIRAELLRLAGENAQLRDVLADRDMDREMAAHANRELAALKARTRWQPIETAPKDGQTILAHKPSGLAFSARQDVVPVHWTGWGGGAWENSTSGHKVFDDLTHWMPLHEPPAEQGEG